MRNYPAFPRATPHQWAGSPRVPHPSATFAPEGTTFDLHALGTPPALILSQDQTLHQNSSPVRVPPQQVLCTHTTPTIHSIASSPRTARSRRVPEPPGAPASGASVLHLRPPGSRVLPDPPACSACAPANSRSGNQPVNVRAPHLSTTDKKKTAHSDGVTPGSDALASRLRSSSTTYKAKPSGLLVRARFSACQHLLTERDYRHACARVSREIRSNLETNIDCSCCVFARARTRPSLYF